MKRLGPDQAIEGAISLYLDVYVRTACVLHVTVFAGVNHEHSL